ncbi:LacI family DNA-binding transcriptional regulator [Rhizobium sp. BK251]|uniref:LacI family DNA-binding transcriptional regulator n=1 Tax=Rhizobium sp. BK251 TaxID=2512125 RepID=UPI00104E187D|nr:LacI family DNA-binding transcriptional regulator [Rhizobium sp. BK251]TCL65202.1 LacI family transcriptional regulator [Rhizobium sp. BK251]
MARTKVTIQDIADKLGLSKFSVSRALSGQRGVGEATRNLVLCTAQAMGYPLTQDASAATSQVLFIRDEIDTASNEVWLNVMHGAEREGEKLGLAIVPRQARYLQDTDHIEDSVVGLILAVPHPSDWATLAMGTGLPVVCAGHVSPMQSIDQVVGADWESGYAVAGMLAELGHVDMAYVHRDITPLRRSERFRGFRDGALAMTGAMIDDVAMDARDGFRDAFFTYLRSGRAPTALFCAHDGLAASVIFELVGLGIRIPEDISVVGFNDFALASEMSPPLTTVRTPQVEMGAEMVRRIADRLFDAEARERPPLRVALLSEIVKRESIGPAAEKGWLSRTLKLAEQ